MIGIKIRATALAILLTLLVGKAGSYTVSESKPQNFLVVGVDSASQNTDVISVVRMNSQDGRISLVQIPRDTYCNLDVYNNKINHIYSEACAKGENSEVAVSRLKSFLLDELSIKIDAHILIDGDAFYKLVDAVGGVDIDLPDDLTLYSGGKTVLTLSKGINHLDPASAMLFVRHRSRYTRGDIDRLEMQSVFIKGLFGTLTSNINVSDVFKIANILKTCETDISTKEILSIFSNRKAFSSATFDCFILPGEAAKAKNGIWYYVLNKRGCDELLSSIFMHDMGSFDKDGRFLNADDADFKSIYFR